MRSEELNWMDVENYLKQDDRLVFTVGACEQHGYLSLMADILIPQAIGDAACLRSGVLQAAPLNFGVSPYFLKYPGTITLRTATFIAVLEDMVRSAHAQGFRRLLFLNGHGGNAAGRSCLAELANALPELKIRWYEWWVAENVTRVAEKHGLKSYHAAWIEAFKFTQVADLPEGAKIPVVNRGILSSSEERKVYGDGVFGGPYQADPAIMDEVFETAVQDVVELLKFE